MKKLFVLKVFVILFGAALVSNGLWAKDIYVAQSAMGTDSGLTASDAHGLIYANTIGNWGPGDTQIGAGDTVHLVGVFTNGLSIGASGGPGLPITILFEKDAKFSAPYWVGAISLSAKNYITIDGGVNGIIECTDNGTGMGNHVYASGVVAGSCSFFTVQNLTVRNLYVRTNSTDSAGGGNAIQDTCSTAPYSIQNFMVSNCVIYYATIGIVSDTGPGCQNYEFCFNDIYNCNWGGSCSDRNNTSVMTGLKIHHNKLHDWVAWNDTVANSYHHNGFYGWAESGGTLNDVEVYGNIIGPNYGWPYSTSGVFFSGAVNNILIYNNIFLANSNDAPANGMITIGQAPGFSGVGIYNNDFLANGSGNGIAGGVGTTTYIVKNNIAVGCTFILFNSSASATLVSDYNLVYNLIPGQEFSKSSTSASSFLSFAQWQRAGFDLHGINGNPQLLPDYSLATNSAAIGRGVDLSAIFAVDRIGQARTNGWDLGAMAFEGIPPVRPKPPTGLRVLQY